VSATEPPRGVAWSWSGAALGASYAAPAAIRSERWVLEKPFGTSSLLDIIEQAISDAEALTSRV